jgi:DUF4097 and DUF4098 domain-containing protein YvlB
MASYPPPPPGFDPRFQRAQARAQRDAFKAQRQQYRYQTRSLRRGSILGPVLLVAVGVVVLLLQTGKLPQQRFWEFYGRWWPLLFILGGVVLLAEWALDQRLLSNPQRPQYRRSVGGGIVLMLIVFAIAGGAAQTSNLHDNIPQWFNGMHFSGEDMDQFLGDKHEFDQTLDQALPAHASLTVTDPRGDITVTGTSDDGQVHVTMHKEIYSRSDSDAAAKSQQLNAQLTTVGDAVALTLPSIEGTHAGLTITLPAHTPVTVNADRGDVHVSAIQAPVTILANHGDIAVNDIAGPVTAHVNSSSATFSARTVTGRIALEGKGGDLTLTGIDGPVSLSGDFFGSTHLEHITGGIVFHTSRTDLQLGRLDGEVEISPHNDLSVGQAVGPVTITTRNRNITLDRIAGDVAVTNRNGTIDLTAAPPLGRVTIENRSGSVKLILPTDAGFALQADTTNATLHTDFPLNAQDTGSRQTLNGTVGKGGTPIHISTTNGDISIDKGTVAPLPPTPPKVAPLKGMASAVPPAQHRPGDFSR